jgi:hypothetical protein
MVLQQIATLCGYGVKLMVSKIGKNSARYAQGIVKLIIRVIHLIDTEDGLQTTFIKGTIMGHKGQTFYQRFYLSPYLGEHGGIVRILTAEAVNLAAPVIIVVGLWLDQGVERIYNLSVPDYNNSY